MDGAADLASRLAESADRLDELAEIADLMGDDEGAARFRRESATARDRAIAVLDGMHPPGGD